MVRKVPRARAGLRRFAASPWPAAPPAPIRVCASSINRTIGFGEFWKVAPDVYAMAVEGSNRLASWKQPIVLDAAH